MKIKVITFDLYNTLVETGHSKNFFKDIYKLSKAGFGLTFQEYRNCLLRNKLEEVIRLLPKEFEDLIKEYHSELLHQIELIRLYPESKKILNELSKEYDLYLISNLSS